MWKKFVPHPNLAFAGSTEDEHVLSRSIDVWETDREFRNIFFKISSKILKCINRVKQYLLFLQLRKHYLILTITIPAASIIPLFTSAFHKEN